MSLKKVGTIVAAAAGIIGLGAFVMPILRSDAPPYAGLERVARIRVNLRTEMQANEKTTQDMIMDATKQLTAQILVTVIVPLHSRECESRLAHKIDLAASYVVQLNEKQNEYRMLTGNIYPLDSCP